MKKIVKYITLLAVTLLATSACDYDDTNFANLTTDPDPNASYYIQFKDASQSMVVEVDPGTGDIISDVNATITVALMGMPLSQDVIVNLKHNTSGTATTSMYELSASSVTIPAGQSSASVTVSTVAENMPVDEEVSLKIDIESDSNATAGTTINYTMLRPGACLPMPGVYKIDMADSYGDGWQTTSGNGGDPMTLTLDGTTVIEFGMCTPYEPSPFECTPGDSAATTTVEIPEGTEVAEWYFPGDSWGEISFTITAPDGTKFRWDVSADGVRPAGPIDFKVCK